MLDLMFLAHNRAEFTRASFETLLANTDWDLVRYLYIVDDCSCDGAYEYLDTAAMDVPCNTSLVSGAFGGPVAAMNEILDRTDADILAKLDNDTIVPPDWLNTMLTVLKDHPHLDALGMEPGFASPLGSPGRKHTYLPARWIGGQGCFRTRAFQKRRPKPDQRWFGLTQWQRKYANAGWIDPDLAVFNLDHVPAEPWRSLAASYVEQGWSRPWAAYSPAMRGYWEWWTDQYAMSA